MRRCMITRGWLGFVGGELEKETNDDDEDAQRRESQSPDKSSHEIFCFSIYCYT